MRNTFLTFIFLFFPSLAFAIVDTPTDFKSFVELLLLFISRLVQIFYIAMWIGLLYGVAMYMMHSDDTKKQEQNKEYLIYTVIGIAVVTGLWGLIAVLNSSIFAGNVGIIQLSPPS